MGYEMTARRITNKLYFFRKNYGRLHYFLLRPIVFIEVVMKLLSSIAYAIVARGKNRSIAVKNSKAYARAIKLCLSPLPSEYKV